MSPMSPRLLRPRASGGFDPKSISSLAAWYDAADIGNVVLNGSNVSQITDKSGNGRHATQETAGNQPEYSTAKYNGKNVVTFTSTRSLNASVPYLSANTFFLVATKSSSVNSYITGGTGGGSGPGILSGYSSVDYHFYTPGDGLVVIATSGPSGLNIAAFAQTDGSLLSLYFNGAFVSSKSPGTTLNGVSFNKINAQSYGGDVAELLIYQKILSASERSSVTSYLGNKWGVTVT